MLTLARPIIDAQIVLANPATGTLVVEGAERPHRDSQFTEGVGVPAAAQNKTFNTIFARQREAWDRFERTLRQASIPYGPSDNRLPVSNVPV